MALMPQATPAARKPGGAVMPPSIDRRDVRWHARCGHAGPPRRSTPTSRSSAQPRVAVAMRAAVDDRRRLLGSDVTPARSGSITAYWPQCRNSAHAVQSCAIFSGTQMCGTIVKPMLTKCDGSCVNAHSVA